MGTFVDINTVELLERAKNGDREALDTLVEGNLGLVKSVARRFLGRGYEADDLFQIGSIGLIKAIIKFDSSFGVKFSTYAVPMIMGEIKRFMRDDGPIKVSRSLKETFYKASAVKEALTKTLEREPSVAEIAAHIGVTQEDLVMSMEASFAPESLYSLAGGDSNDTGVILIDRIDDKSSGYEGEIVDKIAIRQILDTLTQKEKQIIILRYFKNRTQVQVAKRLGISQVQVSRIEKRIMGDMKEKMESMKDVKAR